jgi:protein-L-isoaspartate(D-aspartate) O-methyltransferase
MNEDDYYTRQRLRMVSEQIEERGIRDQRVLEVMRRVPRHRFVPAEHRHLAYADCPLPIESHQTISQPYIVALMTQLLELQGDEIVLEIGTGSGYQAAVLALLAHSVYTIERYARLADRAARILAGLDMQNVHIIVVDGSQGWPDCAPYDAILATAAAPQAPRPLLDQLSDGGRLVIPVGDRGGQYLERWLREADQFTREQGVPVAFVPLVGRFGWQEDRWE